MVKKIIILASGKGTRMENITDGNSKEMLIFNGKTMISLAIEEALSAGFSEIGIVTNKDKTDLNNFLLEEKRKGLPITLIIEEKQVNLITSIQFAEDFISGENFGMIFPDMLILGKDSGMSQLVSAFNQIKKPLIGLIKPEEYLGKTWYFEGEKISDKLAKVNGIVRDSKSGFRFFPRYILPSNSLSIINSLEKADSEVPLLEYLMKKEGLYGVFLKGDPIDVGIPLGYIKAKNILK
ncbi:MAG: sugar phosphate nucleotidyltransferase [Nanoarchaeota archaeon]